MKQHSNSLPLNLVDGERDDDDDDDDEDAAESNRAERDYDEIDEDDHDDELSNQQKIDDRLSPDEHAKATAAAVAHISGTSEYISFRIYSINITHRLFVLHL